MSGNYSDLYCDIVDECLDEGLPIYEAEARARQYINDVIYGRIDCWGEGK